VSNPTPASAPTTLKARHYRIAKLDLNEINRVLQDIGLRLDRYGAIAQNPDFKGRRIINLRAGTFGSDGVRKDQVVTISDLETLLQAGTAIEVSYSEATNTWTVTVQIKADNGLAADANGIFVKIKNDNGLAADASGIFVKRKTDYGIDVDADGLKLLKQSHIADAAAVSSLTLNAGTDQVDRAAFNTALGTLVTEINAIKNVVNSILLNLENAKINATV